jgi:hypothetical protein
MPGKLFEWWESWEEWLRVPAVLTLYYTVRMFNLSSAERVLSGGEELAAIGDRRLSTQVTGSKGVAD